MILRSQEKFLHKDCSLDYIRWLDIIGFWKISIFLQIHKFKSLAYKNYIVKKPIMDFKM
jgi:hypothetical protein